MKWGMGDPSKMKSNNTSSKLVEIVILLYDSKFLRCPDLNVMHLFDGELRRLKFAKYKLFF